MFVRNAQLTQVCVLVTTKRSRQLRNSKILVCRAFAEPKGGVGFPRTHPKEDKAAKKEIFSKMVMNPRNFKERLRKLQYDWGLNPTPTNEEAE